VRRARTVVEAEAEGPLQAQAALPEVEGPTGMTTGGVGRLAAELPLTANSARSTLARTAGRTNLALAEAGRMAVIGAAVDTVVALAATGVAAEAVAEVVPIGHRGESRMPLGGASQRLAKAKSPSRRRWRRSELRQRRLRLQRQLRLRRRRAHPLHALATAM